MTLLGESRWAKLSCILLVLTLLLHLICFSVPHWAKTNEYRTERREHIGLWRYCTYPINGHEKCDDFINIITSDWLKACQSFMTLAMFVLIGAVAVVGAYAFTPDMEGDTRMLTVCLIVTATATVFNIIGVSVYGARYQEYFTNKEPGLWNDVAQLSWAFAVGVTVCVGSFLSFVLVLMEVLAEFTQTTGGSYPHMRSCDEVDAKVLLCKRGCPRRRGLPTTTLQNIVKKEPLRETDLLTAMKNRNNWKEIIASLH
ncbi:hypothetical protein LSAT2_021601 [Lamellibrachia satsuma]|nr:hypothetical protein LSAT2_021601 [Lamellibrachia satsuma]